ncbi:glycosyltransferase family 2 protein [Chryseobacterium sp. RLHN22]|uniref:glycosyltransferase family 2 protein n=1 Tax=Chryseobacterium sp. RLHN22 TaxID=3437885 RepID=UPI003D9B9059
MKPKISFLVGLKNNLEYTIFFYENVRKLYPSIEIVFVSFGSTDGTHEWLENLNDENLKYYFSAENKTLSDTYNKATEISTGEYVCFLHNDMILGKNFVSNLEENIADDAINCYKIIEPPIFTGDVRDWKINQDFGDDIQTFNFQKFFDFEDQFIRKTTEIVTNTDHTSFFLCVKRSILMKIGGLDNLFDPMFCEDDDLIIRLKLLGLKTILVNTAIVYHFVSKTSRFSEEYANKTKIIEDRSRRNFFRKWGFSNRSDVFTKYDIGIVISNGNLEILEKIEPFGDKIYVDFPFENYVEKEQTNTKYSLTERIKPVSEKRQHDIMIYVNGKSFNDRTYDSISNLHFIIKEGNRKFVNPNFFMKIFHKVLKPYRPLIFFNKPRSIENSLITKQLGV